MSSKASLAAAVIAFLAPTFLAATPVEILPPELRGAVQPHVAVTPSGRIHIVFGKDNAIYHVTSQDTRVFSAPVKIGELEKLALRMRRGPRITATDKLVLVTAISHADGNLHAWTSGDAGKTWKETAALNTVPNSASEGLQALAGDGRGLVAAVWLDARRGKEVWGRISLDGGVSWGDDASIYQPPEGRVCECCAPSVAISPTGEIAALWRNSLDGSRDLYMATSRDARSFSAAQKIGSGTWRLNACPMDGGNLTFAPGGDWLAVWRRERTVFASDPRLAEKQLATNSVQPVAAYAGKLPVVLWETNGALLLQRADSAPARFAENAASASIASGSTAASVAWEATVSGAKTIVFDQIR